MSFADQFKEEFETPIWNFLCQVAIHLARSNEVEPRNLIDLHDEEWVFALQFGTAEREIAGEVRFTILEESVNTDGEGDGIRLEVKTLVGPRTIDIFRAPVVWSTRMLTVGPVVYTFDPDDLATHIIETVKEGRREPV